MKRCLIFLLCLIPNLVHAEDGAAKMKRLLLENAERSKRMHPIMGDANLLLLREQLKRLGDNPHPQKAFDLHSKLGQDELRMGHLEAGIKHLQEALNIVESLNQKVKVRPEIMGKAAYELAVGYMRLGETENCCLRNNADSCILPIQGGGVHTKPNGSRKAIEFYSKALKNLPNTSPVYHKARWLLNICYMTLAEYPDKVPADYLLPPKMFQSESDFPRFRNLGPALGIDGFDLAGSAIADDFDNDNDLDLIVSTLDPDIPVRLYLNNGDGSFSIKKDAGLQDTLGGINLSHADFDNDGHMDFYVLRGGWLGKEGHVPNSLMRNLGGGVFKDVTFEMGLGDYFYPTQAASWADFDNDGDLDLFVGNEQEPGLVAPCQLFRNDGDRFVDVAEQAGVSNGRFTKAAIWGDFNNDRFPDLYLSHLNGSNRLFQNNQDGTFSNVAARAGVDEPFKSFPTWFFDYNNDGNLDIYVASYYWTGGSLGSMVADQLGQEIDEDRPRLYQGDGKGNFKDVTKTSGVGDLSLAMGANFGDLDNDGYLDYYLGTGYPDYEALMPNVMYRNRGDGTFENVTYAGGFGHLQKGHGVVFADLDHDGDMDIYEQIGGFLPGDKYGNALFENPAKQTQWIGLHLVGVTSNRTAIGAKIQVDIEEDGKARSIYRWINSGGNFGSNPYRQTIGLGKASIIKKLVIIWPSGKEQRFENVTTKRYLRLVEGGELVDLNLKPFAFKP